MAMPADRRAARARISLAVLGHMLDLPEDHRIVMAAPANVDSYAGGYVDVMIVGPSLAEVKQGTTLPTVNLEMRRDEDGVTHFVRFVPYAEP